MPFRKEPPHTHGSIAGSAIVLVNLGTPDAPTRKAVKRYLKQFLSDPRVVEIPRKVWWFILTFIILPFRSGASAKKYQTIWTREGSPLKVHTQKQAKLLGEMLEERGHEGVQVRMAMRYGSPSLPEVLDQLKQENCDRIAILPAYPQYSGTTTASIWDAVFEHYRHVRNVPELRLVKHYHDHDGYIAALADSVDNYWEANGRGQKLVMSFHGVPKRTLLRGDPYYCECQKTARLLAERLRLSPDEYLVTFQSRFGRAEWLQPYTAPTVQALAREGVGRVDVICPGFTSDCLETLEEISMEVKHDFEAAGGKEFHYIPCLNTSPSWIVGMAEIAEEHLIGWPTMMSPSQREAQRRDAELGREHAARLGA
ncbi:ferrochelatase [Massilia sp. Dwa41.01b]|uniref:ferrochelatase n=1 Tax=unclassified Massilia TaxID=2609279 RepID=UPI0015FFECC0|nr:MULTISPECIES: ferrochelatase [unclassified Massilia]QNA90615.1 ferrochelatase [Massilia sp. Dwa41.01b]QNA97845.1 ferrochelatase [Massilia sp. Se16.2.3]